MAAVDLALQFIRQYADAIDKDYRKTTSERMAYLTSGLRHGGMLVWDTTEKKLYILSEERDTWVPVGSGSEPHTHDISDITGLQALLDSIQATLDGKASTTHTHAISDVTNLQTTLDGKALINHTHSITNVANLQTILDSKASSTHTHAIADVVNLQTTLNGKAATVHTHTISDITSLHATLDGKAAASHIHAITDITNLQSNLNLKSNVNHGHIISDITNLQSELNLRVKSVNNVLPDTNGNINISVTVGEGGTETIIVTKPEREFFVMGDLVNNVLTLPKTATHILSVVIGGITITPKASENLTDYEYEFTSPSNQIIFNGLTIPSGDKAYVNYLTENFNYTPYVLPIATATVLGGIKVGSGLSVDGVTGVMSTMPHTHAITDVTGLQTTLNNKADISHTHAIADVTGLQTALNGKASTTHTHTISDVTGLQTALDNVNTNFLKKAETADIDLKVNGTSYLKIEDEYIYLGDGNYDADTASFIELQHIPDGGQNGGAVSFNTKSKEGKSTSHFGNRSSVFGSNYRYDAEYITNSGVTYKSEFFGEAASAYSLYNIKAESEYLGNINSAYIEGEADFTSAVLRFNVNVNSSNQKFEFKDDGKIYVNDVEYCSTIVSSNYLPLSLSANTTVDTSEFSFAIKGYAPTADENTIQYYPLLPNGLGMGSAISIKTERYVDDLISSEFKTFIGDFDARAAIRVSASGETQNFEFRTDGKIYVNNVVYGGTSATPYSLPNASASVLGGVKVGSGLTIDGNGVLSVLSTNAYLPLNLVSNQTVFQNENRLKIGRITLEGNGALQYHNFTDDNLVNKDDEQLIYVYPSGINVNGIAGTTSTVVISAQRNVENGAVMAQISPTISTTGDARIQFFVQSGDHTTKKKFEFRLDGKIYVNDLEYGGGSGGSAYTLPIATASVLGGVKVGSGLAINTTTGILSTTAVDWSTITNKPTTFTSTAHTHTIANITGLQTALDAKGTVKTVNGVAPDANGNVTISTSGGSGDYLLLNSNISSSVVRTGGAYLTLSSAYSDEFSISNATSTYDYFTGIKHKYTITDINNSNFENLVQTATTVSKETNFNTVNSLVHTTTVKSKFADVNIKSIAATNASIELSVSENGVTGLLKITKDNVTFNNNSLLGSGSGSSGATLIQNTLETYSNGEYTHRIQSRINGVLYWVPLTLFIP